MNHEPNFSIKEFIEKRKSSDQPISIVTFGSVFSGKVRDYDESGVKIMTGKPNGVVFIPYTAIQYIPNVEE